MRRKEKKSYSFFPSYFWCDQYRNTHTRWQPIVVFCLLVNSIVQISTQNWCSEAQRSFMKLIFMSRSRIKGDRDRYSFFIPFCFWSAEYRICDVNVSSNQQDLQFMISGKRSAQNRFNCLTAKLITEWLSWDIFTLLLLQYAVPFACIFT